MTRFDQSPRLLDSAEILHSIGDVAYEWQLDTDDLSWSGNAAAVLGVALSEIASGRNFARRIDGAGKLTRVDVIQQATRRNSGDGVSYQTQYAFKRGDEKIWLEDTGRWFAAPGGRPQRAFGIVRVITERHERERRLVQRAKFDPLTGELNRVRLTEVLGAALDEAVRFRSSCGFLLVAIDNLGHLNEAYGFDVADAVDCAGR